MLCFDSALESEYKIIHLRERKPWLLKFLLVYYLIPKLFFLEWTNKSNKHTKKYQYILILIYKFRPNCMTLTLTAIAPPIHFFNCQKLPAYKVQNSYQSNIIWHHKTSFFQIGLEVQRSNLPGLLIQTLCKPPMHMWLGRACSCMCIHFKFNHVSANRRHPPKEFYRGYTLFSVHSKSFSWRSNAHTLCSHDFNED